VLLIVKQKELCLLTARHYPTALTAQLLPINQTKKTAGSERLLKSHQSQQLNTTFVTGRKKRLNMS